MKFQLSISSNYVNTWGLKEAVREVMQNALDSKDQGNDMKVTHVIDTLRISNDGVKLDPSIWLMGTSDKGHGQARGGFGEGLKLGVLALVRAGHKVKIINGDESWSPKLEESESFPGQKVLTIYTHKRREDSGKFLVEIEGVSKDVWEVMKERFLDLSPPNRAERTPHGEVLFDHDLKGKIFVKGIYIETDPRLSMGYNLNVKVDRDRRMVDRTEAEMARSRIWDELATRDNAMSKKMMKLLFEGSKDVADAWGLSQKVKDGIEAAFVKEYGGLAVPVRNMAESREVEHYGKVGVVVPLALASILEESMGDVAAFKAAYSESVKKSYGWSDLREAEKLVWINVIKLVDTAAVSLGYSSVETRTTVVDFNSDDLNGLHTVGENGGTIQIARKLLIDAEALLGVLVHEVSHAKGGDGEKNHEVGMRKLFTRIISQAGQI